MRSKKNIIVFLLSLSLLVCSCSTPHWELVKKYEYQSSCLDLNMKLPANWAKYTVEGSKISCYICIPQEEVIVLTKDHPKLNLIAVTRLNLNRELQPSKKHIPKQASIIEIADTLIGNWKSFKGIKKFNLMDVESTSFLGYDGFKIHFSYEDFQGLPYEAIVVGAKVNGWLYSARLIAPSYYYFQNSLSEFEQFISSLTLLN